MIKRRAAVGLAATALLVRPGRAQEVDERNWPDRPLRLVVPYAPGGTNDIAARLLAQRLGEAFGQPAVVENRPGAQAILGTELVARARPDGLTLLVAASGPIVFNPATNDRLSYDPLRDLAPVSLLVTFPLMLLVAADSPHRTVADLVAFARANPDKANYGAPAASMQLASELFNQRAATRFQHVAYRGSAEIVTAVASGDLTTAFLDMAPVAGALAGGRVRALAVTAATRLASHPDIPHHGRGRLPRHGRGVLGWRTGAGRHAPGHPGPAARGMRGAGGLARLSRPHDRAVLPPHRRDAG